MIVRPGSQADYRRKCKKFRDGRDSAIFGEIGKEQYYADKAIRVGKNKEALKFFVDCLKEEFSDEQLVVLNPVFDLWERRHFVREAALAYHDVKNALGPRNSVLYRKLGKCQGKLKRFLVVNG